MKPAPPNTTACFAILFSYEIHLFRPSVSPPEYDAQPLMMPLDLPSAEEPLPHCTPPAARRPVPQMASCKATNERSFRGKASEFAVAKSAPHTACRRRVTLGAWLLACTIGEAAASAGAAKCGLPARIDFLESPICRVCISPEVLFA